jgi:shikimate dehydrogenase
MKTDGKIFGIVGCNIGYTLSPTIYNSLFKSEKIRACYRVFDLAESSIDDFMNAANLLNLDGFNVTIPFKTDILTFLHKLDRIAAATFSVNQVICRNGKYLGYNTDYDGIASTLRDKLRIDVKGKRIAIIGSGGSARTAYYYSVKQRAKRITVYHRSVEGMRKFQAYARTLPRREEIELVQYDKKLGKLDDFDLCINATPAAYSTLHSGKRSRKMKLFELGYTGRQPKSRGHVNGFYMLAVQAARNFEIMTGRKVSTDRILTIIREARRR